MSIEDEMAMHETNRWELKELVLEMIANAYENGYEGEIKDLSDEDLARDIYYYLDMDDTTKEIQYTETEILAAVQEIRN